MYYADEVRQPEEAPKPQVRPAEVEMAKTLIENLAAKWDPERYHDRYRNELLDLLEKKAEGEPLPEPQQDEGGEVVDLMEALRQSVAATQEEATRRRSKKAPREAQDAAASAQSFLRLVALSEYRRKRDPKVDARAVRLEEARQEADLRRPAPRRAPAALRLPAREERRARVLGRAEGRAARARREGARRARRGPPARVREVPRRDPARASTAAGTVEIWDNGTYELLEEKRERPADVRPARQAAAGHAGRSCPAHMDGKEQNWLLIKRSDDDDASRGAAQRTYKPMLATLDDERPARRRLDATR